jgi:hypothetical protein
LTNSTLFPAHNRITAGHRTKAPGDCAPLQPAFKSRLLTSKHFQQCNYWSELKPMETSALRSFKSQNRGGEITQSQVLWAPDIFKDDLFIPQHIVASQFFFLHIVDFIMAGTSF